MTRSMLYCETALTILKGARERACLWACSASRAEGPYIVEVYQAPATTAGDELWHSEEE